MGYKCTEILQLRYLRAEVLHVLIDVALIVPLCHPAFVRKHDARDPSLTGHIKRFRQMCERSASIASPTLPISQRRRDCGRFARRLDFQPRSLHAAPENPRENLA